jgi:hypothetical protein
LNTYFAAPERADTEELAAKIAIIHLDGRIEK